MPRVKAQGFTLIEVLVAVLILSIGLLGMAGLQLMSLQASNSSLSRSQATILSYDLIERMRRNSSVANNYEELFSDFPDIPASGGCLKTDCGPASLAIDDVTQWNAELERTMPGAVARLQQPEASEPEYTLFIAWSESNYGQNNSNMSYEITFEL